MTLNGTSSKVLDIASVAGMPLVDFTCEDRPITNLAPLRGAPLRKLNAGGTRITDCSALQGMPLEELVLGNTAIRDLKPLHGAPIRRLSLDRTLVEDLSPLIGMPLNYLIISATKVRDLSPLVGLPVEELLCDRLPADADVASLLELPKLRRIKISRNQKNVEKLRMHPAIEQIHFANPGSAYEPDAYRPAVEAWAAYDAHQAAGKK